MSQNDEFDDSSLFFIDPSPEDVLISEALTRTILDLLNEKGKSLDMKMNVIVEVLTRITAENNIDPRAVIFHVCSGFGANVMIHSVPIEKSKVN